MSGELPENRFWLRFVCVLMTPANLVAYVALFLPTLLWCAVAFNLRTAWPRWTWGTSAFSDSPWKREGSA